MDVKTKLNLPEFPWDRILKICAIILGVSLVAALCIRSQTVVRIVQVIDVLVILGLILFATFAILKRYTK